MWLDSDFEARGLAITIALQADVAENESGKTLSRVQNGLNLQLNNWSPVRELALFRNLQLTRTSGDQLFGSTALDGLAPSMGGGGRVRSAWRPEATRRNKAVRGD